MRIFCWEKVVGLMLFEEDQFREFSNHDIPNPKNGTSALFSIDAESPEEMNELSEKVKKAGGTIYGEPGEKDGWMYGCGFIDPDGHRRSFPYMDMSKLPQN